MLGILGIGQEYRHHTIRVTFAAQPRRSACSPRSALLNGLFGLYIGFATPLLCFGVGGLILKARHFESACSNRPRTDCARSVKRCSPR